MLAMCPTMPLPVNGMEFRNIIRRSVVDTATDPPSVPETSVLGSGSNRPHCEKSFSREQQTRKHHDSGYSIDMAYRFMA
jgi:hypothetical protein